MSGESVKEKHEQENTLEMSSDIEVEGTLKNPTIVEKSRKELLEEEYSIGTEKLKGRIKEAVEGGCDMRARFTVVSGPDRYGQYLSFKTGDIITGVKQTVKPNFLKGTLEGKEGLVYITDVEPLG